MSDDSILKSLFGWRKVLSALFFVVIVLGSSYAALHQRLILSGDWVRIVYYCSLVVISLIGGNAITHVAGIFKKGDE